MCGVLVLIEDKDKSLKSAWEDGSDSIVIDDSQWVAFSSFLAGPVSLQTLLVSWTSSFERFTTVVCLWLMPIL